MEADMEEICRLCLAQKSLLLFITPDQKQKFESITDFEVRLFMKFQTQK